MDKIKVGQSKLPKVEKIYLKEEIRGLFTPDLNLNTKATLYLALAIADLSEKFNREESKKSLKEKTIRQLLSQGFSLREIAKKMGFKSHTAVLHYLKESK